jgi:hypothetical protein
MYVSSNRLRVRLQGGRFGNGGTAPNASGDYNIAHGVGTVRTCMVTLNTSTPGSTALYSCWPTVRVSGTVIAVKITSLGAARPSLTIQGYWAAIA